MVSLSALLGVMALEHVIFWLALLTLGSCVFIVFCCRARVQAEFCAVPQTVTHVSHSRSHGNDHAHLGPRADDHRHDSGSAVCAASKRPLSVVVHRLGQCRRLWGNGVLCSFVGTRSIRTYFLNPCAQEMFFRYKLVLSLRDRLRHGQAVPLLSRREIDHGRNSPTEDHW